MMSKLKQLLLLAEFSNAAGKESPSNLRGKIDMKTVITHIVMTFAVLMICGTVPAIELHEMGLSESEYQLTTDQGMTRIAVESSVNVGQPGYPELPAFSYRYVIPSGRQVVGVRILNATKSRLPGEHDDGWPRACPGFLEE
jgi:hypothetical protein